MTAPLTKRVRCVLFGHDWRRVISPREGYYVRCRRCWISAQLDGQVENAEPAPSEQPADAEQAPVAKTWRPGELQRQA